MITAVDHVQLAAPEGSEDALRTYYVGALGMTELPKPLALAARGGCWFAAGPVRLHLGIGHRRFYSCDPVGNRLEFLEPAAP